MSDRHSVLVLGGGVGGLVAAVELRKKLPRDHRVVLVDRRQHHLFDPSLLWLMTGGRTRERITRPLERLREKGVEVVTGEIERIDPDQRKVTVDGAELEGEHLIVALGAEYAPEMVSGLAEAGHNFYALAGAEGLRDALREFRGGRLVVLTAAPVYKCPAAPYEAAMLLEYDCRKRKVRDDVQIDLYAAEPGPMGVAGPTVSAGVREMVESKRIAYHPEHQVERVDPEAKRITFANGTDAGFDLLAYVPPHRASRVVRESGLTGESGWVPVDRHSLETSFPRVYAIGDVTSIPLELGKPLPKAGVFAHGEAKVVADNIAGAITGNGRPAKFDGHGECFVEAGDGKAGFGRGNFYAEPLPEVGLHKVGRRWHVAKVLFERKWLRKWF
ncbi:MAG: FAD/NAD(P)-binding oxidoreductase [bacterium]